MGASAPRARALQSCWCTSRGKRWMDIIVASLGLVLLSPLLSLIALAVRISSGNPVIFRQWRTGRNGREFQLLKFRTMAVRCSEGPRLTQAGDSRVTPIGKWLRKLKLDELPQLVNVLRGEMSVVGPRPDLEDFWKQTAAPIREVLSLIPGLTGAASLAFRDEERLLARLPSEQVSKFYIEELLPMKAQLDLEYAAQATFLTDCGLVLRTIAAAAGIGPTTNPAPRLHEYLSRQ